MALFDSQKILVAFCSPHRKITLPNGRTITDTITFEWHQARNALSVGTNANFIEFFANGMEVGEAREAVTRRALAHTPRPEFIFWLDDDVLPDWDAFVKLLFRARTYIGHDIFAGVYAAKGLGEPLIYAGNGSGPFWDWAVGDLLTTEQHGITGVHSGLTLVRTSLYQRMIDAGVISDDVPFYKTVKEQFRAPSGAMQTRSGTEDLYFCQLAEKVGAKILVDTSVLAGHICKATGITWGIPEKSPPAQRAKWLGGADKKECASAEETYHCDCGTETHRDPNCPKCQFDGQTFTRKVPLKLALDLGAGGHARSWPGHRTYTTDLRADAKPDYVQDTRYLNLPDNHYDLIASSHHMEHIPRFDQEKAWAECFRVCKPGGHIEHIVPSGEWAAAKIVDGQCDEHVMNVLYGAQESHGYARELNLHFFIYTKTLAKALAEAAGFVNVTCEDWSDTPALGYNLIVRGEKPGVPTSEPAQPAAKPEEQTLSPNVESAATGGAA